MKFLFFPSLLVLSWLIQACQPTAMTSQWLLTEPNGRYQLQVGLEDGQPYYLISAGDQILVDTSRLGIIRDDTDLSRDLQFVKQSTPVALTDRYELTTGKQTTLQDQGVGQSFTFANAEGKQLEIQCRAYVDGFGIRCVFPETDGSVVKVKEDLMEFNLGNANQAWLQPYDTLTTYTPAYEVFYESYPIGIPSPKSNGWCYPALFQFPGHWALLSESGIDGDYAGMHLAHESPDGVYRLRWPEAGEAMGLFEVLPSGALPWQTSWKTISLSPDLPGIVASDVVKRLAAPSKIADTDWIRPGKASWSWLSDHDSPQDYARMVPFIDLAADMGWPYFLVDANWEKMKNGNVEELIAYATEKGVDILMWYNSGGDHNEVTEGPRGLMDDPAKRRAEFAKLQEWGVKGVKIDFFQSDKPAVMRLYRDILVDAAKYEILVNFHGCTIPRGWSRTYPNLMSMESVRGAECYSFSPPYPEHAPQANTILPFTRNVVGPMDYTPLIFTDVLYPPLTSYGHELALAVVFESGIQHFSDAVAGYRNLPAEAKTFLQAVPTTWDEVRLVAGFPGKEVVIARRKGEQWFIGGINGENTAKSWELDLSFLPAGQSLVLMTDGITDSEFAIQTVPSSGTLTVEVLPYGGFAAMLK
jgi:hypothetical protein